MQKGKESNGMQTGRNRWMRRALAALLAVLTAGQLSTATVQAAVIDTNGQEAEVVYETAEVSPEAASEEAVEEFADVFDGDLPGGEELFADYVEALFFGDSTGNPDRRSRLNDAQKVVYDALAAGIRKVADGERSSTEFTVSESQMGDGASSFDRTDLKTVITALQYDHPYELYWWERQYGYSYDGWDYTIYLTVSAPYSIGQVSGSRTADTAKTGAAKNALTNAQAIVTANASKGDYEKVKAYKETICDLLVYNDEAAANGSEAMGSNPWEIIYVFDNDPATNVVCEGYAKAFQYLMNASTFASSQVRSYLVDGVMSVNGGGGNHMWNVVRMNDDRVYLADITNCDDNSVGAPDYLFLAGQDQAQTNGYVVNAAYGSSVSYVYSSDTFAQYDESEITIATADYDPDNVTPVEPTESEIIPEPVVTGTDITPYITVNEEGVLTAYSATDIANIRIPDTCDGVAITGIGNNVFENHAEIESVVFPSQIATIGNKAFRGTSLGTKNQSGTLIIPATVDSIGVEAFASCRYLGEVIFRDASGSSPQAIVFHESWGDGDTFSGCAALQKITLSNRIQTLPATFAPDCTNLTTVEWSAQLKEIREEAFKGDVKLENADFSNTELTEIGASVFENCPALQTPVFPATLENIGANAFSKCALGTETKAGDLILPESVLSIGHNAFYKSKYLGTVTFREPETSGKSIAFSENWGNGETFAENPWLKEIRLSDQVTTLPEGFAKACPRLTTVIWSATLTKIGENAFKEDPLLVSSYLENTGLVTIEASAFESCKSLPLVHFPETLTTIGASAFAGTAMGTAEQPGDLMIPVSVDLIGYFAFQNCSALRSVTFADYTGAGTPNALQFPTTFGQSGVFRECAELKSIALSNKMKSIPEGFARDCTKLRTVSWPAELTLIVENAFNGDIALNSGDLSGTAVTEIGPSAFYGCVGLEQLILPATLEAIDRNAFNGAGLGTATDPGTLVIPATVKSIGVNAFSNTAYLGTVRFAPDTVGYLNKMTLGSGGIFSGSQYLTTLVLSDRLEELPYGFARECPNLTRITIPESIKTIQSGAFYHYAYYEEDYLDTILETSNPVALNYDWAADHRTLTDSTVAILRLNKTELTLAKGGKEKLFATIEMLPETAKAPAVTWTSRNSSIAAVASDGTVTGKAVGKTTIEAVCGKKTAICEVTIEEKVTPTPTPADEPIVTPVTGASGLDPQPIVTESTGEIVAKELWLIKGKTYNLGAGHNWLAQNPSGSKIVTVSKKVSVKAVNVGRAILTDQNDSSLVYQAHVINPVLQKKLALIVGETQALSLTGLEDCPSDYPVAWSSANPEVAQVSTTGQVTAIAKGSAKITAYVGAKALNATVTVKDVTTIKPLEAEETLTLAPNQTALIKFADRTVIRNAVWTAEDGTLEAVMKGTKVSYYENDVVRLTPAGKVTAIGAGDTTLILTMGEATKRIPVHVTAPTTREVWLNVGKSKTVKITGVTAKKAEWTVVSTEDGITPVTGAEVKYGKVTGRVPGDVIVNCTWKPYEHGGFVFPTLVHVEDPIPDSENMVVVGNKYSMGLTVGQTEQLTVNGLSNHAVLWKSNKNAIAFVDENGLIWARSRGTARLTTKINGKAFTVTVIVNAP